MVSSQQLLEDRNKVACLGRLVVALGGVGEGDNEGLLWNAVVCVVARWFAGWVVGDDMGRVEL